MYIYNLSCIYTFIYIHIHAYMYIYNIIYVYIFTYVYIYIYMIHTNIPCVRPFKELMMTEYTNLIGGRVAYLYMYTQIVYRDTGIQPSYVLMLH